MSNSDQIEYWNGKIGEKWVHNAERLDALLEPFADEILDTVSLIQGEHVLDVGCGAGALTHKASFQVGDKCGAIGIDVSKPLLKLAKERAIQRSAPARFECVDAALYRSELPVDALVSRFGVMFFDDPVSAFANLRDSVRPEGRMTFACWQTLAANDWARAPLDVALPLLPQAPTPPPPGAPGPFAFADKNYVADILQRAGWRGLHIEPWHGDLTLPGRTPAEAARFMLRLGPVARLVAEAGIDLDRIEALLSEALAQRTQADGRVSLPAAAWIVSATAS
jgi:SAM-dependent methyltransferase